MHEPVKYILTNILVSGTTYEGCFNDNPRIWPLKASDPGKELDLGNGNTPAK